MFIFQINTELQNVNMLSIQRLDYFVDVVGIQFWCRLRHHCSCHCTYHFYFLSEEDGEGTLQLLLHRIGVGLNLPAVIVGSVVTKEYKISDCTAFDTSSQLVAKIQK